MQPKLFLLILAAASLCRGSASDNASQKCYCLPCGSPCSNPSPPPPEPEYYPPPPPQPEYYPPPPPPPTPENYPPPPPTPSPPPPLLPPTPSTPYCPPPPLPPSPPSPPTPTNPCCSSSFGGTPYFGPTPPGQLYRQDPTFRPSAARESRKGKLVVIGLVGLLEIIILLPLL